MDPTFTILLRWTHMDAQGTYGPRLRTTEFVWRKNDSIYFLFIFNHPIFFCVSCLWLDDTREITMGLTFARFLFYLLTVYILTFSVKITVQVTESELFFVLFFLAVAPEIFLSFIFFLSFSLFRSVFSFRYFFFFLSLSRLIQKAASSANHSGLTYGRAFVSRRIVVYVRNSIVKKLLPFTRSRCVLYWKIHEITKIFFFLLLLQRRMLHFRRHIWSRFPR